jgi:hypothetical protein
MPARMARFSGSGGRVGRLEGQTAKLYAVQLAIFVEAVPAITDLG